MNNYEPIFDPTYSKEQRRKLYDEAEVSKKLNTEQKFNLMWWELLSPKKINKFYEQLDCGYMVRCAYEYADND